MPVRDDAPSLGLLRSLMAFLRPPQTDPGMQELMAALAGSGGGVEDAFRHLQEARNRDPRNLALRNAEHAAFAQTQLNDLGPLLGTLFLLSAVPAYSGFKAGVQALPPGLSDTADRASRAIGVFPVAKSTRPDLQEIQFGLLPLLGGLPQMAQIP